MNQTSNLYRYSAATQGFILWSAWAFYINSNVSLHTGIKAGVVQGVFSFISTLLVISILTKLVNYFERPSLKIIIPPCLMVLMLSTVVITIHTIAKTPEIVKTIAPSLIIAALFCSFTTYKLTK